MVSFFSYWFRHVNGRHLDILQEIMRENQGLASITWPFCLSPLWTIGKYFTSWASVFFQCNMPTLETPSLFFFRFGWVDEQNLKSIFPFVGTMIIISVASFLVGWVRQVYFFYSKIYTSTSPPIPLPLPPTSDSHLSKESRHLPTLFSNSHI